MPNPSGVNGFTPPSVEVPYGEAEQNAAVQRSAPLAGRQETAQATNAPRRAQRQAVRGAPQETPQGPPPQMPGQPGAIAPSAEVVSFWQQIAAVPGASPLVQQIAQEAAGGSQNVPAA
jgi:hypothetical protein